MAATTSGALAAKEQEEVHLSWSTYTPPTRGIKREEMKTMGLLGKFAEDINSFIKDWEMVMELAKTMYSVMTEIMSVMLAVKVGLKPADC